MSIATSRKGSRVDARAEDPRNNMPRIEGNVKWFSADKGYGYITGDDEEDYHVHQTTIRMNNFRTLAPGERVSFEKTRSEGRLGAIEVRKVHQG